jgi:hypothetical protein
LSVREVTRGDGENIGINKGKKLFAVMVKLSHRDYSPVPVSRNLQGEEAGKDKRRGRGMV